MISLYVLLCMTHVSLCCFPSKDFSHRGSLLLRSCPNVVIYAPIVPHPVRDSNQWLWDAQLMSRLPLSMRSHVLYVVAVVFPYVTGYQVVLVPSQGEWADGHDALAMICADQGTLGATYTDCITADA